MEMKRTASLLLAIIVPIFLLSGCRKRQLDGPEKASTTCANITMGMGAFAARDEYIFFSDDRGIWAYDMLEKKTTLVNGGEVGKCAYINVLPDYIYYTDPAGKGIYRLNRNNGASEQVLENGGRWLYIDGEQCYYLVDGASETLPGAALYCNDLTFQNPKLISENVISYYAEQIRGELSADVFVIALDPEDPTTQVMLRTDARDIYLSKMITSYTPGTVFGTYDYQLHTATAQLLWEPFSYQVMRHENVAKEMPLPIYSRNVQFLGEKLIYLDDLTAADGKYTLKSYDPETEQIRTLWEDVWEFCILQDRYICIRCADSEQPDGSTWLYYDQKTEETVIMHQ